MRDMPAALDHSVEASSATAAPPAKALPRPEAEFSLSWNPAAWATTEPSRPMRPATACATRVRAKNGVMVSNSLLILLVPKNRGRLDARPA